jgi:RHS repeat-associated protein
MLNHQIYYRENINRWRSYRNSYLSLWRKRKKPIFLSLKKVKRLPGQYYDQETNLHYNHFRYYDPQLGRYITSDPIGITSELNTYNYVNVNPLSKIDPRGLFDSSGNPQGWEHLVYDSNMHSADDYTEYPEGPFDSVCGEQGTKSSTWIPDSVSQAACRQHDRCYSTCGKTKLECDVDFLRTANVPYALVVMIFGGSAYEKAQEEAGCENCKP